MVRRWSYINNLNALHKRHTFNIKFASLDVVLNTLMYLRRDFPVASQSFRKNWTRRKHMNSTFFLANIMISWAKEYRFYKNYNKMTQYQYFFPNTYLGINLVIQKGTNSDFSKHELNALGSSMTLKVMRFFRNQFIFTRFKSLMFFPNSSWSYSSFPDPFDENNSKQFYAPHTPLYYVPFSTQTLLPIENTSNSTNLFRSTLHLILRLLLAYILELRKLSIKTLLLLK